VSVNSVNIVHSVNKVVNPHKDYNHYVGGGPPHIGDLDVITTTTTDRPTDAADITPQRYGTSEDLRTH
jgi:hypothetical protein